MNLKHMKQFLEPFGISLKTTSTDGSGAYIDEREIYLDLSEMSSDEEAWSMLFHELAHFYCAENSLYSHYHNQDPDKSYMLRYGLKIEKYVDGVAGRLFGSYFPDIEYIPAYDTQEDIDWFYHWIEREY